MNLKVFQYAIPAPEELNELNHYLNTNRVTAMTHHVVSNSGGATLVVVVETANSSSTEKSKLGPAKKTAESSNRIDYRDVLSDSDFQIFRRLREIRKQRAQDDGIEVFNIFNNAQLAEMVTERVTTEATLQSGGEWNRCDQGVPFLGFVIYPDRVRLNSSGKKRFRKKYRKTLELPQDSIERQARSTALFAHCTIADDASWRRMVIDFYKSPSLDEGEGQEQQSHDAGRVLEQHCGELPLSVSQQEPSRQPQQEPRVPGLSGPRNGGEEKEFSDSPPGDALSRATKRATLVAKTKDKTSANPDICELRELQGRRRDSPEHPFQKK